MKDTEILEQWVQAGFTSITLEQAMAFDRCLYGFVEELVEKATEEEDS